MTARSVPVLLTALLVSACERSGESAVPPEQPAMQRGSFVAEHDFGEIPHGESRSTELEIPLPADGGPWIPVGFQRGCTCAKHEFSVIAPDGTVRSVAGIGGADPADAVPAGGSLKMQLTIDSGHKEAADLTASWTPGQVIVQEVSPRARRQLLPIRFSFGIRTPIELVPSAHLDLGEMPRSMRYRQSIELRPREGIPVSFGEPTCIEAVGGVELRTTADIEARIEPLDDGNALLHVEMRPDDSRLEGPFAAEVIVPTDLRNGYVLRVPVSGSVVPDLRVSPPGWLSFGPFRFDEARHKTVIVTDHDASRPADFHVLGIVDSDGNDVSEHFSTHLNPVAERPRSRTLRLDYLGTITERSFRGEVLLAKELDAPPLLRIRFTGFDRR